MCLFIVWCYLTWGAGKTLTKEIYTAFYDRRRTSTVESEFGLAIVVGRSRPKNHPSLVITGPALLSLTQDRPSCPDVSRHPTPGPSTRHPHPSPPPQARPGFRLQGGGGFNRAFRPDPPPKKKAQLTGPPKSGLGGDPDPKISKK